MSVMLQEIYEQPEAVERAIGAALETVKALVLAIRTRNIQHVVIAARGTSDNAGVYAKYLIEIATGIPVGLSAPSVVTLYGATLRYGNCLVVGISQSGQATDVVQVVEAARAGGALTACITNVADSPITHVSDFSLFCNAGDERAVAATKTYTTSLALVALLAAEWSQSERLREGLRALPAHLRETLRLDDTIAAGVERYRYIQECAVLARGLNLATALEAALKMTETSYLVAKPYSAADFLHGPIAMVSDGFPCILYAPDGQTADSMVAVAHTLAARGAELIIAAHTPAALAIASRPLPVSCEVDELLSPIVYILPGQLWACHLARCRGRNPDSPRGLTKVTLTR